MSTADATTLAVNERGAPSSQMEESLEAFSSNHAEMFAGAAGGVEGEHRLEWCAAPLPSRCRPAAPDSDVD